MDVQTFWKYSNNFPADRLKMRDSLYLFKQGYRPVWEDRRNLFGGSWTFRMPKSTGPDVWTRVQLLAIGETLESVLDEGEPKRERERESVCDSANEALDMTKLPHPTPIP